MRPVRHISRPPSRQNLSTRRWRGNVCVPVCARVCASETWCVLMCGHTWRCVSSPALREGLSMSKWEPKLLHLLSWASQRGEEKWGRAFYLSKGLLRGSWGVGLGLPWAHHLGPFPGISSKWDRVQGLCTCSSEPGRLNEAQICPADPGEDQGGCSEQLAWGLGPEGKLRGGHAHSHLHPENLEKSSAVPLGF